MILFQDSTKYSHRLYLGHNIGQQYSSEIDVFPSLIFIYSKRNTKTIDSRGVGSLLNALRILGQFRDTA